MTQTDMTALQVVVDFAQRYGWPLLILIAIWRRDLILPWAYRELKDRVATLEAQNERLLTLALKGTAFAEFSFQVARQQVTPRSEV